MSHHKHGKSSKQPTRVENGGDAGGGTPVRARHRTRLGRFTNRETDEGRRGVRGVRQLTPVARRGPLAILPFFFVLSAFYSPQTRVNQQTGGAENVSAHTYIIAERIAFHPPPYAPPTPMFEPSLLEILF